MNKAAKIFFSESGMKIINGLFLLYVFFPSRGNFYLIYLLWIAYLIFGIKTSSSRTVKIANAVFITYAVAAIIFNIYVWLNFRR